MYLQSHPVALGFDHAKITIIPRNQKKWKNDSRFSNKLSDGKVYVTIGAGPKKGKLTSGLNREKDVIQSHNTSSTVCKDNQKNRTEDELIEDLLNIEKGFKDTLDYEFFPNGWSNGHNSNSFVSGFMKVAQLSAPKPADTPGFTKPVPSSYYGSP